MTCKFVLSVPLTIVVRQRGIGIKSFLSLEAASALPAVVVICYDGHGESILFFLMRLSQQIVNPARNAIADQLEVVCQDISS